MSNLSVNPGTLASVNTNSARRSTEHHWLAPSSFALLRKTPPASRKHPELWWSGSLASMGLESHCQGKVVPENSVEGQGLWVFWRHLPFKILQEPNLLGLSHTFSSLPLVCSQGWPLKTPPRAVPHSLLNRKLRVRSLCTGANTWHYGIDTPECNFNRNCKAGRRWLRVNTALFKFRSQHPHRVVHLWMPVTPTLGPFSLPWSAPALDCLHT